MCIRDSDVGAAVCLAGNQRYLGHGGLGIGIDNLGAMADDAVVLLHRSGQEAGNIFEGYQSVFLIQVHALSLAYS